MTMTKVRKERFEKIFDIQNKGTKNTLYEGWQDSTVGEGGQGQSLIPKKPERGSAFHGSLF